MSVLAMTDLRQVLRSRVRAEAGGSGRHVLILAIDGVGVDIARAVWQRATITTMRSVFPTTSSAAWLTSLTGMDVSDHGIPGAYFALDGHELLDVFTFDGDLAVPDRGNVFSDARELGYDSFAVLGDLGPYPCSWRDLLLRGATSVPGPTFVRPSGGRSSTPRPAAVARSLESVLDDLFATTEKRLAWVYVELDLHLHAHGWDDIAIEMLQVIEEQAVRQADRDVVVVAYADHGVVPTRASPEITNAVDGVLKAFGASMGGAGRARWVHGPPGSDADLSTVIADALRNDLPVTVSVEDPDERFVPRSLGRSRVGDVLLVAQADEFLIGPGWTHEHGSDLDEELLVPFAEWSR